MPLYRLRVIELESCIASYEPVNEPSLLEAIKTVADPNSMVAAHEHRGREFHKLVELHSGHICDDDGKEVSEISAEEIQAANAAFNPPPAFINVVVDAPAAPSFTFDQRELATILAALAHWRTCGMAAAVGENYRAGQGASSVPYQTWEATAGMTLEPLTADEVTALCQRLQWKPADVTIAPRSLGEPAMLATGFAVDAPAESVETDTIWITIAGDDGQIEKRSYTLDSHEEAEAFLEGIHTGCTWNHDFMVHNSEAEADAEVASDKPRTDRDHSCDECGNEIPAGEDMTNDYHKDSCSLFDAGDGPPPGWTEYDSSGETLSAADQCPECQRSFGPHYTGPCNH